jgi:hypothetical protein
MTGRRGAWPWLAMALLAALVSLALWWPGIVAYDTVRQYDQALAGHYDDWHPPIMARLWALFLWLGLSGSGPMLLAQLLLYWGGLGLLAAALARQGAKAAAIAAILIGFSPLPFDWSVTVVKDSQLVSAMTAATGILAWYRLDRRALPGWALAIVALLLGYAMLVRANAIFAAVPLALAWSGWLGMRRWFGRAALLGIATLAAIGVSGPINHGLFGAERSGVEKTLPIFDLAGIAHFAPGALPPNVDAGDWEAVAAHRCYTPFYWDPFADHARCGDIGDAIADPDAVPHLFPDWAAAIAHHPLAYAEHRLAHLNATLRVYAPASEKSAAAPPVSQPNTDGLGIARAGALAPFARGAAMTPLGAPIVWLAVALGLGWCLLGTPRQPARDIGLALALSACLMTASFAVVSIASDLRYHLWLMMGTALSAVLLGGCRGVPVARLGTLLTLTVGAVLLSVVLRAVAPPMPI